MTKAHATNTELSTLQALVNQTAWSKPNGFVCKAFDVGLLGEDWVMGRITAVNHNTLSVQIVREGNVPHQINQQWLIKNTIITDNSTDWILCKQ